MAYKVRTAFHSNCMMMSTSIISGAIMSSESHAILEESNITSETLDSTLDNGERWLQIVLLTGFVAVLAIEAWLIIQAVQVWL
jgi:hypothetical protein